LNFKYATLPPDMGEKEAGGKSGGMMPSSDDVSLTNDNFERLFIEATEHVRTHMGLSIDVSGCNGFSPDTIALLANQNEKALAAKKKREEEVYLEIIC
jgi:hypothetical protein